LNFSLKWGKIYSWKNVRYAFKILKAGVMMINMPRYGAKIISIAAVIVVMSVLMVNFNSIFTDLNCNALEISDNTNADLTHIPSKINFLDDDKKSFIEYCKNIYGSDLPLKIDDSVYMYFGTVNGYRFYRLQPSYITYDNINQQEVIGGYTFESSSRYRPERTGLYIIGDSNVYTLSDAYEKGLVDISKVYALYIAKIDQ
jgi:prepilin peptidase dependent protein B